MLETYRSEFPQTVLGYSGHELGDHPNFQFIPAVLSGYFCVCKRDFCNRFWCRGSSIEYAIGVFGNVPNSRAVIVITLLEDGDYC